MLTKPSSAAAPSTAAPAPARSLDDLIAYFEGDWVAAPRREGQHHDPRVHVRDGDVRGHPRRTGTRSRGSSTDCSSASTWSASATPRRCCSWRTCRPSTSWSTSSSRPSAGTVPRGHLHPAVVLQEHPGDRRPAPPPRPRAVRDHDAVRELHRHREGRPDHDLVLASKRRRGAAGPGQDRRRLREHGVPEVRGGAQRLRRGPRAHARRPRLRGVGGQPVRGPRRRRC